MTKTKLKEAVAKYAADFKSDQETCVEIIKTDLSEDDAAEVIAALTIPEQVKPGKQTTYVVYDEFETRVLKQEVINPYTNRPETIITGWELGKKRHPKKIEKHNALFLNSFANGANANELFPMLVPVDTMRNGDTIQYKDWATEQGKDLSKDINILLNPSKS